MKFFTTVFLFIAVAVLLLCANSCRKEQFGNGPITFSTDTLTFDTVFTSLGSTTQRFKVFNANSKAVKINDIRLMHLVGTQYRINIDGIDGDQFSNIEIPAKDSIYIFVEVTVNPNSSTTPFMIIDDVNFTVGSETKTVHLQAFGQNAHFHYGEEISVNTFWNNDLPHVIVSHDTIPGVLVDCGATLTINPGCKIFFAGNSAIFVLGNLKAESTSWSDSIVFEGARQEEYYSDKPGQWFGIVFLRNGTCVPQGSFDHCIINESQYSVYAGAGLSSNLSDYQGAGSRPKVTIKNSIVKNCLYNAVYGFNADITAENSIFYAAGDNLLKFGLGGNYNFTHCTAFNTGSKYVNHEKEILLLSNFVADGNNNVYPENLTTSFTNCVIYGSVENEISFNNSLLSAFDNSFHYSDMKTPADTLAMFATVNDNNLFNQEPKFKDAAAGNFIPSDSTGYFSPLIDVAPTGLSPDIFGTTRPVSKTLSTNKFDIGAVETP